MEALIDKICERPEPNPSDLEEARKLLGYASAATTTTIEDIARLARTAPDVEMARRCILQLAKRTISATLPSAIDALCVRGGTITIEEAAAITNFRGGISEKMTALGKTDVDAEVMTVFMGDVERYELELDRNIPATSSTFESIVYARQKALVRRLMASREKAKISMRTRLSEWTDYFASRDSDDEGSFYRPRRTVADLSSSSSSSSSSPPHLDDGDDEITEEELKNLGVMAYDEIRARSWKYDAFKIMMIHGIERIRNDFESDRAIYAKSFKNPASRGALRGTLIVQLFPQGKETIVDDDEQSWTILARHRFTTRGKHAFTNIGSSIFGPKQTVTLHALVAFTRLWLKPRGLHIDHENGNPLDNQSFNLRYVSESVNATNRKLRSNNNNTSGASHDSKDRPVKKFKTSHF
jgi:hypothetical protein